MNKFPKYHNADQLAPVIVKSIGLRGVLEIHIWSKFLYKR